MGEGDARGRSWLRLAVVGIVWAAAAAGVPASLAGSGVPGAGVRAASAQEPPDAAGRPDFVPGEVLVKLKKDAPAGSLERLNRANNARVSERVPALRVNTVKLPQGLSVKEAVARYESSPAVDYAEPNHLYQEASMPNDPWAQPDANKVVRMWDAENTGQVYRTVNGVALSGSADADLDLPDAWSLSTGSSNNVQIGIIDQGIKVEHPDINDNLWTNPGEIAGNGVDDDNNGYVDDVHGWDFIHEDNTLYEPTVDKDTHGTLVGGIAAAEGNNSLGVAGVAYDAEIVPLKTSTGTSIASSDVIQALTYAADKGFEVVNNSYGGGSFNQSFLDAIKRANDAGVVFVAAAGNGDNRLDLDNSTGVDNDVTPFYPASYDAPNVISVSATDSSDNLTKWSNYGATGVDVAAPGLDVPTTSASSSEYGWALGTSMASPIVSGVAALVKSQNPGMTPSEVKGRIVDSADRKDSLQGKNVANGRVNALRALDGAAPTATAPKGSLVTGSSMSAGSNPTVPVPFSWTGQDNAGGSGLARYEVERSVDGGPFEGVALPSALATSVQQDLLPGASYVYRVRGVDIAGNEGAWATAAPFSARPVQNPPGPIAYSGSWSRQDSLGFYGESAHHANNSVDRANLSFEGGGIALVASEGPNRGRAEIIVDAGTDKQTTTPVNFYEGSGVHRKVVFSKQNLDPGPHTVRVKVLETKQSASSGYRVDEECLHRLPDVET